MTSPAVSNGIYVILGATGNTGSIVANFLLLKGKKVRVIGRDAGRLQPFVDKGAEAFTAEWNDAAALTKGFSGARAAYLLLPPAKSRENQERESDAITKAVRESGLRYAVYLSSYGAQVPEGTGPVAGLHSSEQKLNAISDLNVLHLRAAYFMENNLHAIGMIHRMGMLGNALLHDLVQTVLDPAVPLSVRKLFEIARGTLVYSLMFYPLLTVGTEQMFRVFDTAVGAKCDALGAPSKVKRFSDRIKWLSEQAVIPPKQVGRWTAIRHLRNQASHPVDQSILPPGEALSIVDIAVELLNSLFL